MANKRFLDTTMETDFLQSFVRGNLSAQEAETKQDKEASKRRESNKPIISIIAQEEVKLHTNTDQTDEKDEKSDAKHTKHVRISDQAICSKFLAQSNRDKGKPSKKKPKRKPIRSEELYTDKDRAAAVNLGTRDIKQSLKMKRAQDRSKALHIPEEADPAQFLALGYYELKKQDIPIALNFINKALELNPNEKHALVARSKCYILMGQPENGLKDAETALDLDRKFLKGVYQKAESLYYLGDFEHSLMWFHRGLHIRPEHTDFIAGVEKAQKAIETALGVSNGLQKSKKIRTRSKSATPLASSSKNINDDNNNVSFEVDNARKNKVGGWKHHRDKTKVPNSKPLKELAVDKEYFESLLVNPHLKCTRTKETDKVLEYVQETVDYLNKRQEFWRQQVPKTH